MRFQAHPQNAWLRVFGADIDIAGRWTLEGDRLTIETQETPPQAVLVGQDWSGRLVTDRKFLQRALDLGFAELGFTSAESPIVCRDATRQYVWMVLSPDAAVPASDNAYQVDSLDAKPGRSRVARHLAAADMGRSTVRSAKQMTNPMTTAASRRTTTRNSPMPKTNGSIPSNGDLIAQLLDLRKQLRAIEQAVVAVARQLRARRKQQQLMKTTLASLKQLQTLDV